jgi:hypothetical protein
MALNVDNEKKSDDMICLSDCLFHSSTLVSIHVMSRHASLSTTLVVMVKALKPLSPQQRTVAKLRLA